MRKPHRCERLRRTTLRSCAFFGLLCFAIHSFSQMLLLTTKGQGQKRLPNGRPSEGALVPDYTRAPPAPPAIRAIASADGRHGRPAASQQRTLDSAADGLTAPPASDQARPTSARSSRLLVVGSTPHKGTRDAVPHESHDDESGHEAADSTHGEDTRKASARGPKKAAAPHGKGARRALSAEARRLKNQAMFEKHFPKLAKKPGRCAA